MKKKISLRGVRETQTTPKGIKLPVPKREDFFGDLRKVSRPSDEHRPDPGSGQN